MPFVIWPLASRLSNDRPSTCAQVCDNAVWKRNLRESSVHIMTAQFKLMPADPALVSSIQQEFGLPRFAARTMAAHGVASLDEAQKFLTPDIERDWLNPYSIPQLDAAVDRLERAVRDHERIVVFGDFDLDGISATTVLTRGLQFLGGIAAPLIPKRFEEGYGITQPAFERAKQFKPDLIVTVDCGIACGDIAPQILAEGIDLVVTDHHEPGDLVPEGIVVCDPKCDPECESGILAGVGVALKIIQALGGRFGKPHLWREYTDFATLGTIADLMPLRAENRALVADGLERMNKYPRPCIQALIDVCRVGDKQITSTGLSFSLIPRLNAAGRMGDADLALDLLMADDFEEAQELAAKLDSVNDKRRRVEQTLTHWAEERAAEVYHGQRALVVGGEGWHEGVKGIVASRLVNEYGVPVILFTIEGDEARGSGRSVGSVNLFKAVESCSDLLIRFGGHGGAVGLTLAADKLDEFSSRLCAYMNTLPEDSFHPQVEVEATVDLGELTLQNVQALSRLAPFGRTNPTPRFLARNVRLLSRHAVGVEKNHLSCQMVDGAAKVGAIMFHCGDKIESLMSCNTVVDAAFQVQIDEWKGRRTVKCLLDVVEPASPCPGLRACLPSDDLDFVGELYEDSGLLPAGAESAEAQAAAKARREQWRELAAADSAGLTDALVAAAIGEGTQLHDAQRRALDMLANGESAFVVMGTGRGKSLIFQIHAAREALLNDAASVFVYPLRALIADQACHAACLFENFGLAAATLTGESSPAERAAVYAGLTDGSVDVVLTTPEYLAFHVDEIAACGRVRFLAVDEAHHLADGGSRRRDAYTELGELVQRLGVRTVLAATATASSQVASRVRNGLGVAGFVGDTHVRTNLLLDDHRNARDKETFLTNIVASGEKTIVYVNSRTMSVDIARVLRALVPHVAMQIGFYNAGLSREERARIERLFRDGVLRVLVCTSAFGEGVNIPDVRHVVLYAMPFSDAEFNQMSGRAGRDGRPATIHLAFGKRDVYYNDRILAQFAPDHDRMGLIYRGLRALSRQMAASADASPSSEGGFFTMSDDDLVAACPPTDMRFTLMPGAAAFAVTAFSELGLVDVRTAPGADGQTVRQVRLRHVDGKVNLDDSVLYCEGRSEAEEFERFSRWILGATPEELRERIIRPIMPDGTREEGESHDR